MKNCYRPNHYYLFDEMYQFMKDLHTEYPELSDLYSIGKTYENRDIPLLEVTNYATGSPESKPGIFLSGNLHGMEVSGSAIVLYAANQLLENFDKDPEITKLLDENVFYLLPRINPDGAEFFLTTPHTPQSVRGSTRDYFAPDDGVYEEDIDGNGIIVDMRIEDPNGNFKPSRFDSRFMVKREAGDVEGPFYRVFPEGLIRGEDLLAFGKAGPQKALDPNRSFPSEWSPDIASGETDRPCSGPYPLYESEVRAVADFVITHNNIVFANDSHTAIGAHISATAFAPGLPAPDFDKMAFADVSKAGSRLSGYIHDFKPRILRGLVVPASITTWLYFNRGIFAYCTEAWNVFKAAIPNFPENYTAFDKPSDEYEQAYAKVLQWTDTMPDGPCYVPWKPFDHPQLGKVEIGGFNQKFFFYNIPCAYLEEESKKLFNFVMVATSCMPKTIIDSIHVTPNGESCKIDAVIANSGYLPVSGSYMAEEKKYVTPMRATISGTKVYGKETVALKNLAGYSRTVATWIVPNVPGTEITISIHTERAGNPTQTITL